MDGAIFRLTVDDYPNGDLSDDVLRVPLLVGDENAVIRFLAYGADDQLLDVSDAECTLLLKPADGNALEPIGLAVDEDSGMIVWTASTSTTWLDSEDRVGKGRGQILIVSDAGTMVSPPFELLIVERVNA